MNLTAHFALLALDIVPPGEDLPDLSAVRQDVQQQAEQRHTKASRHIRRKRKDG